MRMKMRHGEKGAREKQLVFSFLHNEQCNNTLL